MARRLYFSLSEAAAVTPAFDGGWEDTDSAISRSLITAKSGGESLGTGPQIAWTAGQDSLARQYVSPPLEGAQTISGTVKCQIAAREFANGDNSTSRLGLRVVSNDGNTVRGTLLAVANYGPTTEFISNVSRRNKTFADGDTLTSVNAEDGDRIVVEVGASDAAGTTPEALMGWGAPTGTNDYGENETETTALVPWIEFSADLVFEGDPAGGDVLDPFGMSGFFGI